VYSANFAINFPYHTKLFTNYMDRMNIGYQS